MVLGFNARASHQIVDITHCLLLDPALLALLAPLRPVLHHCVEGSGGDVVMTLAENGVDLLIEAPARLDLFDREMLSHFANTHDLARLSWRRPGDGMIEPLAARRPPVLRFGGMAVTPAPGGFLQPSPEGEAALVGLVEAALTGITRPVADLFAGCGSFSLPLTLRRPVHAVEGDDAALRALKATLSATPGLRLTVERRDLTHNPLAGEELKRFAAVVFDPPRTGAAEQARALAQHGPAVVVAVSCNPATLARDLRILTVGGYQIERITPVDQFPWSAHLEAVAVLRRAQTGIF